MTNFHWPDARGWIGFGCFVLVLIILGMIAIDKTLLDNNAFLVLATAIVITGWANGPVGWAYQATKGGGEQAESTARIAEKIAGVVPADERPSGRPDDPITVEPAQEPRP